MTNIRYNRNRFYNSKNKTRTNKKYKIFFAGCGIGSLLAECALRIGFENFIIADSNTVEISNLNRQNYLQDDIGQPKAESIKNACCK
ncbi:MAG: hypothetical protein EO766_01150 [Hydrotalea sp. AMD]|uniref:ThiF family adenylyltransferase n=1 Tax=Hydrotalea sp. AMD TaxID=2501297 RepID=UPI00102648C4|nr:MAG: hypothetical protein EO766_01150 [Hydrotalea sp. AMD]